MSADSGRKRKRSDDSDFEDDDDDRWEMVDDFDLLPPAQRRALESSYRRMTTDLYTKAMENMYLTAAEKQQLLSQGWRKTRFGSRIVLRPPPSPMQLAEEKARRNNGFGLTEEERDLLKTIGWKPDIHLPERMLAPDYSKGKDFGDLQIVKITTPHNFKRFNRDQMREFRARRQYVVPNRVTGYSRRPETLISKMAARDPGRPLVDVRDMVRESLDQRTQKAMAGADVPEAWITYLNNVNETENHNENQQMFAYIDINSLLWYFPTTQWQECYPSPDNLRNRIRSGDPNFRVVLYLGFNTITIDRHRTSIHPIIRLLDMMNTGEPQDVINRAIEGTFEGHGHAVTLVVYPNQHRMFVYDSSKFIRDKNTLAQALCIEGAGYYYLDKRRQDAQVEGRGGERFIQEYFDGLDTLGIGPTNMPTMTVTVPRGGQGWQTHEMYTGNCSVFTLWNCYWFLNHLDSVGPPPPIPQHNAHEFLLYVLNLMSGANRDEMPETIAKWLNIKGGKRIRKTRTKSTTKSTTKSRSKKLLSLF